MTFEMLVAMLLGTPLPALPDVVGRVFKAPPPSDADPQAEAWDALEQRTTPGGGSIPSSLVDRGPHSVPRKEVFSPQREFRPLHSQPEKETMSPRDRTVADHLRQSKTMVQILLDDQPSELLEHVRAAVKDGAALVLETVYPAEGTVAIALHLQPRVGPRQALTRVEFVAGTA